MKIIRAEDQKTSSWSGGTTTELAIWPKDAVYAERDFDWRLSTATVLLEKSVFTSLPDYDRLIGVREGVLELNHGDSPWYSLKAGEISSFDGAALTRSRGRVTDINLMLRKGVCTGSLESMEFGKDWTRDMRGLLAFAGMAVCALFVSSGALEFSSEGEKLMLEAGDLMLLQGPEILDMQGSIGSVDPGILFIARISY